MIIKKLADEAELQAYYDAQEGAIEKFAELLILECANSIIDCEWPPWSDMTEIREIIITRIITHFGIDK